MPPASGGFHPAFVVPRYGEEVIGGAEHLARATAERLASRGHEVTVLTTQALDHHTWTNHYPPGKTVINGVEVLRFPAETRLGDPALGAAMEAISGGGPVGRAEQETWLTGVVSSGQLDRHISSHGGDYSHLLFLPYLFGTTYSGSRIRPEKSYVIPCLHDEPFARLPLIKEMLLSVAGLVFNSPGEMRLAARLLDKKEPGTVVGMGFERRSGDPAAFRDRFPVRKPFVLYAGRREGGKNTPLLVEYFRRFSIMHPDMASLVLMGSGRVQVPPDCSQLVYDLGRVPEQRKWDGYSAASVFCQPSVNESLSIVLLESWLAGTPALVNAGCEVTSEHARLSGGGLAFDDFPCFSEALLMLLEDPEGAERMGDAGRRYVEQEYNWDSVIERLSKALGGVLV